MLIIGLLVQRKRTPAGAGSGIEMSGNGTSARKSGGRNEEERVH